MLAYGLVMGLVVQPIVMAVELGHPVAALVLPLFTVLPWIAVTTIREPWAVAATALLTLVLAAESIGMLQGDSADRAIGWAAVTITSHEFAGVVWILNVAVPGRTREREPRRAASPAPARAPRPVERAPRPRIGRRRRH